VVWLNTEVVCPPKTVTHPTTNRARSRVTSMICPTPLPLRHAVRVSYCLFRWTFQGNVPMNARTPRESVAGLQDSQGERLIPFRIQRRPDRSRLLLGFAALVRNKFQFDVRIGQSVRVHRNQVLRLANCTPSITVRRRPARCIYTVFQKSDAKIQIIMTTA